MDEPQNTPSTNIFPTTFAGVWLSDYTYYSSSQDAELQSRHYVRILQEGDTIVIESIPELNEGYIVARFNIDGSVVTGSWQESTAPDGPYKGVTYHGAAQLILADDYKSMTGKWVGFGQRMDVKTGPWNITYVADSPADISK